MCQASVLAALANPASRDHPLPVSLPTNRASGDGLVPDIDDLTAAVREFSRERDWEQFHDPKSLVLVLVGEVGERAELFQ